MLFAFFIVLTSALMMQKEKWEEKKAKMYKTAGALKLIKDSGVTKLSCAIVFFLITHLRMSLIRQ